MRGVCATECRTFRRAKYSAPGRVIDSFCEHEAAAAIMRGPMWTGERDGEVFIAG